MASTGAEAWKKHFQPVFLMKEMVETTVKKDSTTYNSAGQPVSRVSKGESILVFKTKSYEEKTPIALKTKPSEVVYLTFNNIQKPKSKLVSGIKLKPQDFKSVKFDTPLTVDQLVNALKEDLEDNRQDLDPHLNLYLTELLNYWSGSMPSNQAVAAAYRKIKEGKAETSKDFGEILGAIACIKKKILPGIKIPANTRIKLPSAGNAPLADYFLVNDAFSGGQLTISAKSGTTTNTLKPKDILELLKSSGKVSSWSGQKIYKFMELVVSTSTAYFPFVAVNFVLGKKVLNDKALEEAKKFSAASFSTKTYTKAYFADLFKLLGYSIQKPPTIGELFYNTEKFVIAEANKTLNPTKIFEAATSGAVTYVKYSISDAAPQGTFEILVTEGAKVDKKNIKWRSKNATNRAADKIGLQP